MKRYESAMGLAVLALALAPACRNAETETPRQQAQDAKEKSQDAAAKVGDKAKEVGDKVAEGAKDLGEKIKEGAKEISSEVGSAKQTADVKAALMLDSSIDASHIDVESSSETKTVTLRGTVPSAAQKAAAERLAGEKAEGWKIRNQLTVAKK